MTDDGNTGGGDTTEDSTAVFGVPVGGPWGPDRAASFLQGTQVPIRLACHTTGGGLWMLSLWYTFRDGQLWCATAADADVVSFLRSDPAVAFEVSVNDPPYYGVRGQATVTIGPDHDKELLKDLVRRYLGDTDDGLAEWLLSADREEVRIGLEPTRLSTWDYSDRMADSS